MFPEVREPAVERLPKVLCLLSRCRLLARTRLPTASQGVQQRRRLRRNRCLPEQSLHFRRPAWRQWMWLQPDFLHCESTVFWLLVLSLHWVCSACLASKEKSSAPTGLTSVRNSKICRVRKGREEGLATPFRRREVKRCPKGIRFLEGYFFFWG